ncbi:MAG: protein kinase, partial [Cyanobacteria bacterium J06631_9]
MQQQLVGHQLNEHYRITAVLGQQSGRRTFLAETADQSLVVIKLVLFGPDFEWADLKLFEREAETLRSLDHPAIPKYLDSFEVDTPLGKGFALVQTYIEAKSLAEWVTAGRRFQEADLQPMARALLSILYYLHSCYPAVIHRDIKPSNILLSEASADGPAKLYLVDFGSVQ